MNMAIVIAALIQVESGGNPTTIGDGGEAVGILQIHPGVIDDVNRIWKRGYTLADRRDPKKSRDICALYLMHYSLNYQQETGRKSTAETLARIWNGGPRGWEKPATLLY